MARARNIKPGFFANELLGEMDACGRILFIGLWCLADREGRLEDRPKRIKMEILPYDDCDVNALLNLLERDKFIVRYESDGLKCIQINKWHKHQNPHHMEVPSEIPALEGTENKFNQTPITKAIRLRIYQRDGHHCVNCGSTSNLSIDHIIAVSKGGTSDDSNLRTLCVKCNSKKGNRDEPLMNRDQANDKSLTNRDQNKNNSNSHADSLIPDSLISDSLIPDSLVSVPSPIELSDPKQINPDLSEQERFVLKTLSGVNNYQLDYEKDLPFIRNLLIDYPMLNILSEVTKWATYKLDKPLEKKSNPRSQLRNWCEKANGWKKEKEGKTHGTNRSDSSQYNDYRRRLQEVDTQSL